MQAKKRAKPVKFGRKLESPKSEARDKPPTSKPKDAEKEEKTVILERSDNGTIESSPESQEILSRSLPLQDDKKATLETSKTSSDKEKENKTTPNEEQDRLIPITQNLDIKSDTPPIPESTTPATLGGDTYIVEKEVKKNMLGYFWLIAVISFVVGLLSMAALNFFLPNAGISAGVFFFSRPIADSPTPKPTRKPSPTTKVLNLAEYSIEILNGSGITGAATKLKESLINDGFKVITVDNADSSDYTDTIIFAKKDVSSEYLINLKDKLKKTYTLGTDVKTPTGATGAADIIITIGSSTAGN